MSQVSTFYFRASSLAVAVAAALVSGCGSDSEQSGKLTVRITDAPVDMAQHVYVQFSGIEIHGGGNNHHTLYFCQDPADATKTVVRTTECAVAKPKQLDLMALTGGENALLLDGIELSAGKYSWIRLLVDTDADEDSYIVLDAGGEHELTIPSGSETGLKLNRGFTVAAGGASDFTIDFDLRKSVHETGSGEYVLRPTLRIVDNLEVGSIAGTVSGGLITSGCVPAVYVYSGADITPDDVGGTGAEPVTTATVKLDDGSGTYRYKAAFLEAGTYTAAFTCDADEDDPAQNDSLGFSGTSNAAVTAKAVTTLDF